MKKSLIVSIILVIAWMGFIFYLSSLDNTTSNKDSKGIVEGIVNTIDNVTSASNDTKDTHQTRKYINDANNLFRKCSHAVCYLILSILVFNLIVRLTNKKILIYNIYSFSISLIYACTDEYHQTFVSGRSGQFSDIIVDTIGIIIGLLIVSLIYKKHIKKVSHV